MHGGKTIRLFPELACVLGDESALHQIWQCKGSGGTKCCLGCLYIVNRDWQSLEDPEADDTFKPYDAVFDIDECEPQTKHTVHYIVDHLADKHTDVVAKRMTKGAFEEEEKILGFNHTCCGLLQDSSLRSFVDPSLQNTYDWHHNILQGIFQKTMWNVLKSLETIHIKGSHLHEFLQAWNWPKRLEQKSTCGKDMFNVNSMKSYKDAKIVKCSCSEALSVHKVIAY